MKTLPPEVEAYSRTPTFSEDSIPPGLLKAHKTKTGTWGKINILDGKLHYRILEPEISDYELDENNPGIVEPTVLHEVAPIDAVSFYVEFYR